MLTWLPLIEIVVLGILFASILLRPKFMHKRLIRKHVKVELAGELSAIYSLGDNAYEVVYFDPSGEKRKAKYIASETAGLSWIDDVPF